MRHSSVVLLDSMLRGCWYSNANFPLSAGLLASSGRVLRRLSRRVVKQKPPIPRAWIVTLSTGQTVRTTQGEAP